MEMVLKFSVLVFLYLLISKATGEGSGLSEESRIIGGTTVDFMRNYPYMVSVQAYQVHTCGGFIIDLSTIGTAAHCCWRHSPSYLRVRAGSLFHGSGGVIGQFQNYTIHSDFDNTLPRDFDVCKLHLTQTLPSGISEIQPIVKCTQRPPNGQPCSIAGWGNLDPLQGGLSPSLRVVQVRIFDQSVCFDRYEPEGLLVTDSMIFAGELFGGRGPCAEADTGGPLTWRNGRDICVAGVNSWGRECGQILTPSVFANVNNATIGNFLYPPRP